MRALRRVWIGGQGWVLEQPEASYNVTYGTKRHPATERVAMNRRRSRRKADRPPRLMARKPSGPDGPRPALEGENKQTREATTPAFVTPAKAGVWLVSLALGWAVTGSDRQH